MESNFVDYVKIHCRSGNGGHGAIHFRREKFVDKGGPDGGDGGRGGHIIVRGNRQLWTLLHLKYRKHIKSTDGKNGQSSNKTGKDGEDVILDVPIGTIIKDFETGEIVGEILNEGQEMIIAKGGHGGKGNTNFKSATNQTPRHATEGGERVDHWLILELKVLADVGLVGFPNAGKSTLLAATSAAKPKVANYAFTTMTPNLGIVSYRDYHSFVMADIPGIIEGAHEGKGLGHRFLRHIERNATLLFMVPGDSDDILKEYNVLLNELTLYSKELIDKPRVLAITKADLLDDELKKMLVSSLPANLKCQFISSITGEGILALKDTLWELMNS